MSEIHYSLLPRDQWEKLVPIYQGMGGYPPIEDLYARVAVAEDNGHIVGNSSFQSVLCIEATRIDPQYSGKVGFRSLHKCLKDSMPKGVHYFAFAIDDKMQRICEYVKLEPMSWKVYRGIT